MTDTSHAPLPPTSQVLDAYDALCETERIVPTRLLHWAICLDGDGAIRLSGEAWGDPRRKDGTQIVTTPVTMADGLLVETRSGSTYQLGLTRRETRLVMRLPKVTS